MTETLETKEKTLHEQCEEELKKDPKSIMLSLAIQTALDTVKNLDSFLKDKKDDEMVCVQDIKKNVIHKSMTEAMTSENSIFRSLLS